MEYTKAATAGDVSENGLRTILTKTIERLEEAPKEKQREIFENVIQFAEFYPNDRIRLGVYSESDQIEKRQKKTARAATGSSGEGYSIFGDSKSSRTIKVWRRKLDSRRTPSSGYIRFGVKISV